MSYEYARTPHGLVLQRGGAIEIDYIPEPAAGVAHPTLTGGRPARLPSGGRVVTFRQRRPLPGGGDAPVALVAGDDLPGLAELVRLAEKSEANEAERRRKRRKPRG